MSGGDRFRVLVVATNAETEPIPVYPIGASVIAGALKADGVSVRGLDLSFAAQPDDDVATAVGEFEPDLIAFSLRAIDNVTLLDPRWYLPAFLDAVGVARRSSRAPIVVGGSGFSLLPEAILQRSGADHGIAGEGEAAIVELARRLSCGAPLDDDGILHAGATPRRESRGAPLLPPSAWSRPDYRAFPLHPHVAAGGTGAVQTKRGCGQKCTYCTYPLIEGRATRLRTPADVIEDVGLAAGEGARHGYFVDSIFNLPAGHALAVCQGLTSAGNPWDWTAYATPFGFDEKLADAMAAAGCKSVEVGSEAATPATLAGLGKLHTADDVLRADRCCVDAGITPAHFFVVGGPGETPETFEQTLGILDRLAGVVVVMVGLRVYPDTALYDVAIREGRAAATDDFLSPVFYLSPALDLDRVVAKLEAFAADRPHVCIVGRPTGATTDPAERLRRLGKQGPLWEYLRPAKGVTRRASVPPPSSGR